MHPSRSNLMSDSNTGTNLPSLLARVREGKDFTPQAIVGLVVLHILLALLIRQSNILSFISLGLVMAFGTYIAMTTKRFERVAYVIAYITGAEVLWRMTDGAVFWEIGKYGAVFLAAISLLRIERVKVPGLLLLYFILLLPAAILTGWDSTFGDTRQALSFYLSGPLAILGIGWFFASLNLSSKSLSRLLLFFLLPVIGIATLSLFGIISAGDQLVFNTESNFATSGGFGPNQVGSLLGLGALVAFLLSLLDEDGGGRRPIFLTLSFGLFFLSLITFSRSGVVMFVASVAVVVVLLVRMKGKAARGYGFVLLAVLAVVLVYPLVDEFTGGKLTDRYTEETTTGRTQLIEEDLSFWSENPIFGVGVGGLKDLRESGGRAAHTEFTRVLGEHGLFGLTSLIVLGIALVSNFLRRGRDVFYLISAACICWGLLFMGGNAMRLVAPAFVLGLSFAQFANTSSPSLKELAERLLARRRSMRASV
jgi:O-antigen ligase